MEEQQIQKLRDHRVRVTPQRALIWTILSQREGHFTAEEIWQEARPKLPGLETSTVYRTLEAFGEAGLVTEMRPPDGPRLFEARAENHPHLICERCERVSHFDSAAAEEAMNALSANVEGFEIHRLSVMAIGICAECRR